MHHYEESLPPSAADALDEGEPRSTPLVDVAEAAVGEFLSPLPRLLRIATRRSKRNARPIHRLRVALRQAIVMLKVFRPLIAGEKVRWMKRRTRRIRIVAGRVRDWDVFRRDLESQAILDAPLRDWIRWQVEQHRRAARKQFLKVVHKLDCEKFSRRVVRIRGHVRWRGEGQAPSHKDWGRQVLCHAVADLSAASQQAAYDVESLHRLRIAAKRLRYTIALFPSALDPATAVSLRNAAAQIQDQLGVLNDRACQIRDLHYLSPSVPSTLEGAFHDLLLMRQIGLERAIEDFHNAWRA